MSTASGKPTPLAPAQKPGPLWRNWRRRSGTVLATFVATLALVLGAGLPPAAAAVTFEIGSTWATQESASDNNWTSAAHGEVGGQSMFAAVSLGSTRIQTSPDGVSWTLRSAPAGINWQSITYGDGKFVAVASTVGGTDQQTMYSSDGITWTFGDTLSSTASWRGVGYGGGKFVAVGTNAVMYSTDGVSWTAGVSPANSTWSDVTYSGSTWVAVASSTSEATSIRAMTSADGVTWTARTTPSAGWQSVTYGASKFVAVSTVGKSMYSLDDGASWVQSTAGVPANDWRAVEVGETQPPGGAAPVTRFVAVSDSATANAVMYSDDGVNWTAGTSPATNTWRGLAYGDGKFVAVAGSGTGNRVMMSNSVFLTFADDSLTIVPPSGVATVGYAIYYNTESRITNGKAWGIWARAWPSATTTISLSTYQTGTVAPCGVNPTVCRRPASIGQQAPGQTMVYRVTANVGGSGYPSPALVVTRP